MHTFSEFSGFVENIYYQIANLLYNYSYLLLTYAFDGAIICIVMNKHSGQKGINTMFKKLLASVLSVAMISALLVSNAFACTMVYVGSDLTDDGSTYLARSEDYSNSYNKIAYVNAHGKYAAGSVYEGCSFTWTFTHDSYSYTATADDFLSGKCPDCGKTHAHTPMEENGTNEKGVSVSSMVTLSWNGKYSSVDPMVKNGMCESDMTTVLLSEAATAKEGVDLLLKIYDETGAKERSGVLIADQNEAWYIENYTGHQYIAVKLSSSMIAISPNMGAIGLVDLDDTENVIASKDVIAVAKQADSFVGDEDANTIDFRASYSRLSVNSRMVNGLNYFAGEDKFTSDNTTSDDFTISNVKDGKIVTMYTPIEASAPVTEKTMVDFYKVDDIGNTGNLEWHIFQIDADGAKMESSTIQWLAMEHGQFTVAIPYLPMYTTDMYEGYKVGGLGKASFVTELPEGATGYYPFTSKGTVGYKVLPEGWEKGYYWSVDALSNYALNACTDEQLEMIHSAIAVMQQKCYDKAAEMQKAVASMSDAEAKVYCTAESAALAKEAHELTLALYFHVTQDVCCWDNGTVTEPEYQKEGSVVYTCTICGATKSETLPALPFSDIAASGYKEAIIDAADKGIVTGYDDGSFKPNAKVTRAQFITMLYRAAGSPEVADTELSFNDAGDIAEAYKAAVVWGTANGMIKGYDDGSFKPNQEINRAQMATFADRYLTSLGYTFDGSALSFTDADEISENYLDSVKAMASIEIIKGFDDGHFGPNETANRGQAATILLRVANYVVDNPIEDAPATTPAPVE